MKVILSLETIDLSHLKVKNHLYALDVSISLYNKIFKQHMEIHTEEIPSLIVVFLFIWNKGLLHSQHSLSYM